MKTFFKFFYFSLLFCCFHSVYSLDIDITDKNVQACYRGEYTRGSDLLNEISITGLIELDYIITFKAGFSAGGTILDTNINSYINISYAPFLRLPFIFSLSWIYSGLPEYEAHTHSLIPYMSYNARYAGISLGFNFRFTSFFTEPSYFESILSFYGYVNFINNGSLRIGIGAGNFNEFHARNLGAYFID
ncbi:MAG: hypothetical protein FWB73_04890, partial [Treponema sp.]|nr:hypothetical protein [Treponema sp.]